MPWRGAHPKSRPAPAFSATLKYCWHSRIRGGETTWGRLPSEPPQHGSSPSTILDLQSQRRPRTWAIWRAQQSYSFRDVVLLPPWGCFCLSISKLTRVRLLLYHGFSGHRRIFWEPRSSYWWEGRVWGHTFLPSSFSPGAGCQRAQLWGCLWSPAA